MRKCLQYIVLVGALFFCTASGNNSVDEYTLKAAYIYNFTKFIEWPSKVMNAEDFVIAVDGSKEMITALKSIAETKKVKNKKVVIKDVGSLGSDECHIVFASRNTSKTDFKDITRSNRFAQSLIISEHVGYCEIGAVINFINKNNKIRFEINMTEANARELKTSSQLIKVAQNICR